MKVSTAFHDSYFLDGVYLTGGTVTVWQMYFKIILKLKQVLIAMI